ncbi:hypothetical protein JTE90_015741 [Oedothorax gibbosus]|uniref:Uncharacterized protein n=1 Tax=Oedothorax gibbosus TaxID=931172 RepID=A0AAV6TYC4_9ARAC|nr:hypothetical protein JTE90_015741 [Oedothorax gibbosus]
MVPKRNRRGCLRSFPNDQLLEWVCSWGNQPSGSQIVSLAGSSQSRLMTENAFPRHPANRSPQGSRTLDVEDANVRVTPQSSFRAIESVNLAETSFRAQLGTPHCCSHNEGFKRKVLTILEELKRDVAILMRERRAVAVRATHPGATESEVTTILKNWLMHAADRDGSRKK